MQRDNNNLVGCRRLELVDVLTIRKGPDTHLLIVVVKDLVLVLRPFGCL